MEFILMGWTASQWAVVFGRFGEIDKTRPLESAVDKQIVWLSSYLYAPEEIQILNAEPKKDYYSVHVLLEAAKDYII